MLNDAVIKYFGRDARVVCDRQCGKAWGSNNRPTVALSDDPDDWAWAADGELGDAPTNPGTYEGGEGKPAHPDYFPNKWCVSQCERCAMSRFGQTVFEPVELRDLSKQFYNMPQLHEDK